MRSPIDPIRNSAPSSSSWTEPAAPEERIASIDAIRGIALFGVLMVNLVTGFRVSIFEQFLPDPPRPAGADRLVAWIVAVLLEQKAFCLFSLLFGVGLAIQFERLSAIGRPLYWLARRLGVLLVLGLVHIVFIWNGDILTEYAIAGALVLPLFFLSERGLLFAALGFLVLYLAGTGVVYSIPWPDAPALRAHVALANEVYPHGGIGDIFRFSREELRLILALHAWVFPRTVALFLLGAFLWRARLFERVSEFLDELALVAVVGLVCGAAITAAHVPGWPALLAPVIFALGYGAVFLALAQLPAGSRLLAPFVPVGRMAFTNYLMQSLIFCFVFFGYGLGQFGRMSAAAAFVLGVGVYIAQMLISRAWLSRFRFGPVEWLWRTLMYGSAQPMRRT